jgi:hypothetical protein
MSIQFDTNGLQNVRRYDRSGRDVAKAISELGQVICDEANNRTVYDREGDSDPDTSVIGLLAMGINRLCGGAPRDTAVYLDQDSTVGRTVDTMDPGAAAADATAAPAGATGGA